MSRIKQAIELLSQEASALEPAVRANIEKLMQEARLLIQPVSHPLDDLAKVLSEMRREATAGVSKGIESAKDEVADIIGDLTKFFESQGMGVNVQCFEKDDNETEEEFHQRVQREVQEFENSAFADEDGEVDLKTLSREELEAYINQLDELLTEASDIIDEQTTVVNALTEKLTVQSKLLEAADLKAHLLERNAQQVLGAVLDFDIKFARELLEKAVK